MGDPVRPGQADFELVIVGAGPAGLSGAVYGASEGFNTLVVDEGGSRVYLEPLATQMLDGKVIDAERHEDHVHFSVADQG